VGSVSLPVTLRRTEERRVGRVSVNPIWSPAETVAASASLLIEIWPQLTTTEASSWPLPSLEVLTVAVLSTVPQLSLEVWLTTCTWTLCPGARSCGPQPSVPAVIDQP